MASKAFIPVCPLLASGVLPQVIEIFVLYPWKKRQKDNHPEKENDSA
jgi:hypothetical protein